MTNQKNEDVNMKRTILITGASGTVGSRALELFLSESHKYNIRAFDLRTRKSEAFLNRYRDRIESFYGDIRRPEDLEEATKGVDVCIHTASVIPPKAYEDPNLTFRVNIFGTENLIDLLTKNSPNAFVVMTSSVAVYGDRLNNPNIRVGDPLLPPYPDNYGESKIRMEELLQKSRLDWSIFRLTMVMGASNHHFSKIMFYMPLSTPIEIITPQDAARALVAAVDHREELRGHIFNLGGGESCRTTYKELLEKNFKIRGLGALDFPDKAFAERNYHCGLYADGDNLEEILHFRRDTLQTYYDRVAADTPFYQRLINQLFRKYIKRYLLSLSKPYKVWHEQNENTRKLFF